MNLQENIYRIKEVMGLNEQSELNEIRNSWLNYITDKTKEITGQSWPEYVLRDWLYRNTKDFDPKKENKDQYLKIVNSYIESFVEGHGKGHWEYEVLDISIDSFTDFVKEDLKKKMSGFIRKDIPKDEERHLVQQSKIEKGGVSSEPIIVAETKYGKYDLLEGWHRTTSALKKFGKYKQNAWVYKLD